MAEQRQNSSRGMGLKLHSSILILSKMELPEDRVMCHLPEEPGALMDAVAMANGR